MSYRNSNDGRRRLSRPPRRDDTRDSRELDRRDQPSYRNDSGGNGGSDCRSNRRYDDFNTIIPSTSLGQDVKLKMYPRDSDQAHVIHVSGPKEVLSKEFAEHMFSEIIKAELVKVDPKTVQATTLVKHLQDLKVKRPPVQGVWSASFRLVLTA